MEEPFLIEQLKQGQPAALERIIERYAAYVSAIVRNVIGDYMKAEDVEETVSDVFVLLWNHAARLRDGSSLKPYLAAIARNQALKKLRSYNPRIGPLENELATIDVPRDRLEEAELREALEGALSSMSVSDREIFLRYYFFMEKTAAIAAQLGMNESTVRSRLSRGRDYLRRRLTEGGYVYENPNLRPV